MSKKLKTSFASDNLSIGQVGYSECYSFSFKYMTTNKHYNLSYFDKNNKEVAYIIKKFFDKLLILSSRTVSEIMTQAKKSGLEYMPRHQFKDGIFNDIELDFKYAKDTKYLVFRFNGDKCRFYCKESETKNVLYVLAIDFDLSAYKH